MTNPRSLGEEIHKNGLYSKSERECCADSIEESPNQRRCSLLSNANFLGSRLHLAVACRTREHGKLLRRAVRYT